MLIWLIQIEEGAAMHRLLMTGCFIGALSGAAGAADLTVADPVPVEPLAVAPAPEISWTGVYLGAQIGYAFGDDDDSCFTVVNGPSSWDCDFFEGTRDRAMDSDSFFAGLHLGGDLQLGALVLGAVADANWRFESESHSGRFDIDTYNDAGIDIQETGTYPTISYTSSGVEWFGTARGRIGFAADRVLVYGTGGLAFGGGDGSKASAFLASDPEVANYFPGIGPSTIESLAEAEALDECAADGGGVTCKIDEDDDDLKLGWALGAGVEMLVTENFSFGLEYLFVDLEDDSITLDRIFDAGELTGTIERENDFHAVNLRGAYRF